MQLLCSHLDLIQHDKIRAEFVRQVDGPQLLIRLATQSQYHTTKIQLGALEILMGLAFNDEARESLLQNNSFIEYLQTLVSSTDITSLKKAADGLLWQLFSKHKTETQFQYDIMISYSHKDSEISHRIYKNLIADGFHVWIDLEEMHGSMMQRMADAIEQSRCILICMSENYFLSSYCQLEAQYAFQKQRVLIPIKVQAGYKPDAWLAFFDIM